jgi:hypothetical protein
LAWSSAAGWLPPVISNAPVYAGLAAAAEAMLIAFGLSSVVGELEREAFGFRQIATAVLAAVLASGIVLQSIAAMSGRRAVGGVERLPAAWAVSDGAARGSFRVLWVGAPSGEPFAPPGGDPATIVEAGAASLRAGLTDRDGIAAVDIGRPLAGPGPDRLWSTLREVLAGGTGHGGALLAPFGVRYVVAREGDLPSLALERFEAQTDMDRIPASGLVIFRNGVALPPAASFPADAATLADAVRSGDPETLQRLQRVRGSSLARAPGGWSGDGSSDGLVAISTEFDDAWELEGTDVPPRPAFGWATAFARAPEDVVVRYGSQLPRTFALLVLAALWGVALWITRRPVGR